MRYNTNDIIFGITFMYEDGELTTHAPYMYNFDKVTGIRITELQVTEHHRVHNYWADRNSEPVCDGFILKSTTGDIWYNQYPTASYGQVTDTGDRMFQLHPVTDEQKESYFDKKYLTECILLTYFMSDLCKGVKRFEDSEFYANKTHEELCKLNQHIKLMRDLKQLIETTMLDKYHKKFEEYPVFKNITNFRLVDV